MALVFAPIDPIKVLYLSAAVNVLAGVALWGVHMGMTQGLLATMVVAYTARAELRGMAYRVFKLMSGLAMLVATSSRSPDWRGSARACHSLNVRGALACRTIQCAN